MNTETDYSLILAQLKTLAESERDTIAILSNASAVLNMSLDDINWAGFYLVREGQLVLGPFQVCGTAARTGATQLVPDVHKFRGHIACDGASNSEIVIPIRHQGKLAAVLDIDSPLFGRFTPADQKGLEECAALLGAACDWKL